MTFTIKVQRKLQSQDPVDICSLITQKCTVVELVPPPCPFLTFLERYSSLRQRLIPLDSNTFFIMPTYSSFFFTVPHTLGTFKLCTSKTI